MNKTIVYLTSKFPYGKSESWITAELNSLINQGNKIIIIPVFDGIKIVNKDALQLAPYVRKEPLLSWLIFMQVLHISLRSPKTIVRILSDVVKQSRSFLAVIKNMAVIPKSIFLSSQLKNEKINHIHALSTTTVATMAHILSQILEVPWSFTLHSSSILLPNYRRTIEFFANSASQCRTVSKITAEDLLNYLGDDYAHKVKSVHLGVNINNVDKGKIKKTLDKFIVVSPAELKSHKGHVYALRAINIMIDEGVKNFKWIFYGEGPLKTELMEAIIEQNLTEFCSLPGRIDHKELLNSYSRGEVDLVVSSSISIGDIFEGIPVSLMEAMSYGIPVVATDCGSTRELVDGVSGLLVPQKDSSALAKAINSLIKSEVYRKSIGEGGRIKIIKEFDSQKNALDLVSIFK